MKALIYKDLVTLKKNLILLAVFSVAIALYGIYSKVFLITPMLFVMLPLILNTSAFSYDAAAKFENLAFSMPINRRDYILSKLFFPVVFGVIGGLFACIMLVIQSDLKPLSIALISLATMSAAVLISAIQLPFLIKFGAEKGRIIMVASYFIIFASSSLLKGMLPEISEFFSKISNDSMPIMFLIALAIIILLIFISTIFAIKFIKSKEY